MWCERDDGSTKGRISDIITYFEGTCEFCIGNLGIDNYQKEVRGLLRKDETLDDETAMLLHFADSVIAYKIENFEDAFAEWKKAEELAEKTGNEEYKAKIYSYLAIYYYVKKDDELSKSYFDKAHKIFEENKLYTELALHYINILWYKRYEKNQQEVLLYLDKALYYVKLSNSLKDARVYLHLGYIYKTIFNDFLRGFKHLTVAREMCYKNGNYEMECMTFHVLADGYMQLDHNEQAVKIYRDIFDTERYRSITANLKCMMLGNLIPAYMKVKNYDNAEMELRRMEVLLPLTQVNFREQFTINYELLRAKYDIVCQKDLEEARNLLDDCNDFCLKHPENVSVENFDFKVSGTLGDYYVAIHDNEMALKQYIKQLELSDRYGKLERMQALENVADIYEQLGSYHEALEYRKEKMDLFESIERERLINQYDRLYKEFIRDIQEEQLQQLTDTQQQLEHDLCFDKLTGIYNRRYFDECIAEMSKNPPDKNYAIIFADVDFFKRYNDGFGHAKGDECLSKLGALMQSCIEDGKGKAFRYGGEEFLLLFEEMTVEKAKKKAEEVLTKVRQAKMKHLWSDVADIVTCSIGCSVGKVDNNNAIENLIEMADKALYHVKDNGRNGVYIAEPE